VNWKTSTRLFPLPGGGPPVLHLPKSSSTPWRGARQHDVAACFGSLSAAVLLVHASNGPMLPSSPAEFGAGDAPTRQIMRVRKHRRNCALQAPAPEESGDSPSPTSGEEDSMLVAAGQSRRPRQVILHSAAMVRREEVLSGRLSSCRWSRTTPRPSLIASSR
jgi:hypothetical protein